ncbi:MAG: hypothetical protein WCJ71_02180 [Candidatus Omnitrophota bacterium]
MMFGDDEGPKEWELKDEEPPEQLWKKWEKEETLIPRTVVCPSCKKETSSENLSCIFCGRSVSHAYCPVEGFLSWIKRLLKGS